jgi:uncharacterized protein (TIGR03118 family)
MRTFLSSMAWLSIALLLGGVPPALAEFYTQHNLVSDLAGVADIQDPSLVNSWGLVATATSPWWVANNATGTSTLYRINTIAPIVSKQGLTVTIPGTPTGNPTGIVANCGTGFKVSSGAATASAVFIFDSEDGSITGWSPTVPPPPPSTHAQIGVKPSDAVYKGLAIACTPGGDFLFAANFHAGTVDVFDTTFKQINNTLSPDAFVDPGIPAGYAPFGIQNIGGKIYVTYALQDADKHDDVPGMGHGYVNAFTTTGVLIRRVASKGTLNSPWGLAHSPADFGKFSDNLLVGNFGDGRIHAYESDDLRGNGESKFRGVLHSADGPPLEIEGLWALQFGNGVGAGPTNTLFFTAGPADESHGLFGSLFPATPPGKDD